MREREGGIIGTIRLQNKTDITQLALLMTNK